MKLLSLILLAAGLSAAPVEKRLSFKDIILGMNEKSIQSIKNVSFSCRDFRANRSCRTESYETVAGVRMVDGYVAVMLINDSAEAIMVNMNNDGFSRVISAYENKYGKASFVDKQTIQNRMGAKFENLTYRWYLGDEKITIEKYAANINQMRIMIDSPEYLKNMEKMLKGNSSDL